MRYGWRLTAPPHTPSLSSSLDLFARICSIVHHGIWSFIRVYIYIIGLVLFSIRYRFLILCLYFYIEQYLKPFVGILI